MIPAATGMRTSTSAQIARRMLERVEFPVVWRADVDAPAGKAEVLSAFAEPGLDENGEGGDRRFGIGTRGAKLELGALGRGEQQKVGHRMGGDGLAVQRHRVARLKGWR